MEKTEIPQVVVHKLLQECEKRSLNPMLSPEKITYSRIREFLKDIGYSHFFENIVKIIAILTRRPPLSFTESQKEELIDRFQEIQVAYENNKGKRKNCLSYSYIMYKFCELLGYDQFLPFLPLLKAPQNLLAADRIWKLVCSECKYQYIPTDPDPSGTTAYGTLSGFR